MQTDTGGGAHTGGDVRAGRDFVGRDWRSEGDRGQQLNVNLENLSRADLYIEIKKLSELLWETRSDIRVAKVESAATHEGVKQFVTIVNAELRSLRMLTTVAISGLIGMAMLTMILYLGYRWRVDNFDRRLTTIERAFPTPTPTPWWVLPREPDGPGESGQ